MKDTGIQWTDNSQNFWWGCVKVAQGCKNCYAEGVATRFYGRKVWGPNSERRIASEKIWNDPKRWNAQAEREGRRIKVFCMSMGDFLEDHPQLVEPRKRAVGIIESTPHLDWQILTKRPENAGMTRWNGNWPANVWFGASAANKDELDTVAHHLLCADAKVRFLSLEPLVGPMPELGYDWLNSKMIHWVIAGGESGPAARPCCVEWLGDIVKQCKADAVPVFVKQLGAAPKRIGMLKFHPLDLRDPKGGDMAEWPEDLRVREFPTP